MKKWEIIHKVKMQKPKVKSEDIIKILLENRGIKSKTEIDDFLDPKLSNITAKSVKINQGQLKKALKRIGSAIKNNEKIIIYGDYDVDGITASAILWESLNYLKANVMPYIPSRFNEGYGLSKEGIDNLLKSGKVDLIITVDNGIVANFAVDYANKKGIDVIITDHHMPSNLLPKAFSIIHTTFLCGAGVAYLLAKEISNFKFQISNEPQILNTKYEIPDTYLELVVLATIADLVPLTKANRTLVFHGLRALNKTKRPGLLALFQKAGIRNGEVGVYEVGYIIAPRLNAMGRLENAMDSLRLICTKDPKRAQSLSTLLTDTNLERQQMTLDSVNHAKNKVDKESLKKLIFIADKSYKEGIVGLIAGRMVEEFYRPSIIISKGKIYSKASARSIPNFNIVKFLRSAKDLLVDVGGHPMAAGFTVETSNLPILEKKLFEISEKILKKNHFERVLRIDLELGVHLINFETYNSLQKLAPFGMANPEPTFLTKDLIIENLRLVGNDGKHLKVQLKSQNSKVKIEGIAFGMGFSNEFKIGDKVDVVYVLSENVWNGNKTLQLKIKDIKLN